MTSVRARHMYTDRAVVVLARGHEEEEREGGGRASGGDVRGREGEEGMAV